MISLATHLLHEFGVEIVIISHAGSLYRITYHNKLYCAHIICIVESDHEYSRFFIMKVAIDECMHGLVD